MADQSPSRPIDDAMAAERPEKGVVRGGWIDAVRRRKALTPEDTPFYLTLAGEGRDISLLIDEGLLSLTEGGAIAESDGRRVIAVEKDIRAVAALKRNFPGLKVIEVDLADALQGYGPFSWPARETRSAFRATVINLDFNGALTPKDGDFAQLLIVKKIAAIHLTPDPVDWTLLLTVQGEIPWPEDVQVTARGLVAAATHDCDDYHEGCRQRLLGDVLVDACRDPAVTEPDLGTMSRPAQQQFLMAHVPAAVAYKLFSDGWSVTTLTNHRYGGDDGTAPMVTFVLDIDRDASSGAGRLQAALASIAGAPSAVLPDGSLRACAPEHP